MANCNNAREGDMSPEELAQCLTDIGQWMTDHAGELGKAHADATGAPDAVIESLEKAAGSLPSTVAELLKHKDGKMPFYDFVGLSAAEMEEEMAKCKASGKWASDTVPLARNADGELLVCGPAGVSSWDADDGLGVPDAPSLSAYLEKYRNQMFASKVEYVEDCGIMEVS
eukprot:CAMPEP_0180141740 /NCGR_PEP_ID=MMETSP0986-20121125/15113_1 /TAXON_ID=697907 /ORGANISM="non described non described, Strain CCMP2293" /LENGTH=169 /DNA_ID=CAMNT_0022084701 /DNA_START=57 /DNA_END=566 /DNA_ORIENTATION=+